VRVIADAQQELVTREYLHHALEREFASQLGPIRTELAVLKWTMGVVIGGLIALIIKSFFA
jgi:hypothetical protein